MKLFSVTIATLVLGSISSSPVQACACCGLDNTWGQHTSPISDYTGSVLLGFNLQSGLFDDAPAYEKDYEVKAVQKQPGKFVFRTDAGDIEFNYADSTEHRMMDITFVTNKNYKYSDNADIYHELILRGQLVLPDIILKQHKSDLPSDSLRKSSNATMVFQGYGNACIEGQEFKKWLIKIDDRRINFQGSGLIKPNLLKSR